MKFFLEDGVRLTKKTWALRQMSDIMLAKESDRNKQKRLKKFNDFFGEVEKEVDNFLSGN